MLSTEKFGNAANSLSTIFKMLVKLKEHISDYNSNEKKNCVIKINYSDMEAYVIKSFKRQRSVNISLLIVLVKWP